MSDFNMWSFRLGIISAMFGMVLVEIGKFVVRYRRYRRARRTFLAAQQTESTQWEEGKQR